MKILKLYFRNINSLRGAYEIDFTVPEYARGGLFAIVGPTGSGKSSILDAVSFALFGKTPRTENQVVTVDEDERKSLLLTRGEKSCEASVVFETPEGIWLSRCRMRHVKSSPRQVALLKLSSPDATDGELLTDKVTDWRRKIDELLGMSFTAFTRTVLLAQGAFGRFLQARPEARAEILEGITGSEIYAQIGAAVYRSYTEAQRAVDEKRRALEALEVLSPEEREKEEKIFAEHDDAVKRFREEEATLRAALAWHEAAERLAQRDAELRRIAEEDEEHRASVEAARARLAVAQRAEKGRSLLECWENALREEAIARRRVSSGEDDLRKSEETLETLHKTLAPAQEAFRNATSAHAAFLPTVEVWREKKGDFERRKTLLLSQKMSVQKAVEEAREARRALERTVSENQTTKERLAKIEENLAVTQILDGWTEVAEEVRRSVTDIREAANDVRRHEESLKKAEALLECARVTREKAQESLLKAQQEEQTTRQVLSRAVEQMAAACLGGNEPLEKMRLLTERIGAAQRLVDLAQDAPYVAKVGENEFARALRAQHERRRGSLSDAWPELAQCVDQDGEKSLATLRVEREALLADAQAFERTRDAESRARNAWTQAQANLGRRKDAVDAAQKAWKEANERATDGRRSLDSASQIRDDAFMRFERLTAPFVTRLPEFADERQKFPPQVVLDRLLALSDECERTRREKESLTARLDGVAKAEEALRTNAQRRENEAKALRETYDSAVEVYKAEFDAWKISWKEYSPETRLEDLEKERSRCSEEVVRLTERRIAETRKREEIWRRLDAERQSLSEAKERCTLAQNAWTSFLAASPFDGGEALRAATLSEEEEGTLMAQVEAAQRRCARMTNLASETVREREALRTMAGAETAARHPSDELTTRLTTLREEERALEARWGQSRELLRADDERLAKRKVFGQEVEELEAERLRRLALNELIGDATGKRFRTIAQGITFRVLIEAANRVLRMMKSRYALVAVGEPPLEIAVIDHDMADTVRSSSNLSGGESFIVSLALALGLSNLSGSRLRVETLFLDEGFGTLDEATLHTALGVLDDLRRMTGRLIGVISHVPAVKERIETQIVVTPERGRGVSRVEGPGVRRLPDENRACDE